MDKKHRALVAVLVAIVMAAAFFSAFSTNLFHKTPAVILPSLEPVSEAPTPSGAPEGEFQRVEVDRDTVQRVVASLKRPESYSRTVTVELQGAGAFGVAVSQVMVDGPWTRVETTLPDGRVEHAILSGERKYLWYDREDKWYEYAASAGTADLSQRIPTYEDVVNAPRDAILEADYRESEGIPCVYVAVEEPALGYTEKYWVSVDTGLLVRAESSRDGAVFYRMTAYEVETPAQPGVSFLLPDGTVLHTTSVQD